MALPMYSYVLQELAPWYGFTQLCSTLMYGFNHRLWGRQEEAGRGVEQHETCSSMDSLSICAAILI